MPLFLSKTYQIVRNKCKSAVLSISKRKGKGDRKGRNGKGKEKVRRGNRWLDCLFPIIHIAGG